MSKAQAPYHTRCESLAKKLLDVRHNLESLYKEVGEDDLLFKYQAKLCDIGQELRSLERNIEENKYEFIIEKDDITFDEYGNETGDLQGITYNP